MYSRPSESTHVEDRLRGVPILLRPFYRQDRANTGAPSPLGRGDYLSPRPTTNSIFRSETRIIMAQLSVGHGLVVVDV